jgi:hypothetical protein
LRLPRHHRADALALAWIGGAVAHDAAAIKDDNAIRDRDQFIELRRNKEDRGAAIAGGSDVAIDGGNGADVEPARRLGGEQERQFAFC